MTYKFDFSLYPGIKNDQGKSIFNKPQYPAKVEGVDEVIDRAEAEDVSALREFILADQRPLYVFGAGGSLSSATYAAWLATQHGIVAQALTPMAIMQLPEAIVRQSRFLAIGASGKSADQIAALEFLIGLNPSAICVLSLNGLDKYKRPTALTRLMEANPSCRFICTHWEMHGDGYVGTRNHTALLVLMFRVFYPEVSGLKSLLIHPEEDPYQLRLPQGRTLADVTDLHLVHAGIGNIASVDLEGRCAECGIVPCMITDGKNFTHGRHTFVHTHPTTCIVMFSGPKERPFTKAVMDVFGAYDDITLVDIATAHDGALGAIELMIRSLYFAIDLSYAHRVDIKKPAGKPKYGGELWKLEPWQNEEYYAKALAEIDKKMKSKKSDDDD